MEKLSQCECGSTDFFVDEGNLFGGTLKDGIIHCDKHKESSINSIACRQCGKEYGVELFEDITFEF